MGKGKRRDEVESPAVSPAEDRLRARVRASDDRYREYWETLDPRDQERLPAP